MAGTKAIQALLSLPSSTVFVGSLALFIAFRAIVVLYRLCFHPLCPVPGPKLAAASSLYIRYYEVFGGGGLTHFLPDLHKVYNSRVIRIAPNHVHTNDIETYKRVFTSKAEFHKCDQFYHSSQGVDTILTTTDPHQHRVMRNAMLPLFTPRDMNPTFHIGKTHVTKVAQTMAREGKGGKPLDLLMYLRAMTANLVAACLMGHQGELVSYDAPNSGWIIAQDFIGRYRWLFANLPGIVPFGLWLLSLSPEWITVGFKGLYQHCQDIGNKYLANKEEKEKAAPRNTIFDGLLDTVSGNKLSTNDAAALFQQAAVLMIAGTGSPAITLTAAIFYTLKSKDIQTNLRSELDDFERRTRGINAPGFDWRVLNQLPYLEAVVKESLRILPSVPGILPRVVPPGGLTIPTTTTSNTIHFLPPGTRISASTYVYHHNSTIFPEPATFNPDRWLNRSPEDLHTMEQYFIPFSKGPRACIGARQSWVHMYTALVGLFGGLEMDVVDGVDGVEGMDRLEWVDDGTAVPVVLPMVRVRERCRDA